MSEVEELELIVQAIAGSRLAVERLLLDHYTPLVQHLTPLLPVSLQSVVSVEDVVQEAYSQAFKDINTFHPSTEESFAAWLKVIAENRLRDVIKSLRRKKRGGEHYRVQSATDSRLGSAANLAEMLSASGSTPSRSLARREAIRAVQVAMAGLPQEYREAVRLRYYEGLSIEEVARAMHRSSGAVRGLIDRAKRAMRDSMGRASKYLTHL
jgi:RNA polymerase sigma-70 factor (ECF subfamily)